MYLFFLSVHFSWTFFSAPSFLRYIKASRPKKNDNPSKNQNVNGSKKFNNTLKNILSSNGYITIAPKRIDEMKVIHTFTVLLFLFSSTLIKYRINVIRMNAPDSHW